jgi:hypothetical protein
MFQVFAEVFIETSESNPWMSPWESRTPVAVNGSMFLIKVDRENKVVLALTNYHVVRFIATHPDGRVKGFARRQIRGQQQDISFKVRSVIPMEGPIGGDLCLVELNNKILESDQDSLLALPWMSDFLVTQGTEVAAIDHSKGLSGGAKVTMGNFTGVVKNLGQTTALVYQGASGCPVVAPDGKGGCAIIGVINSGYPHTPGINFFILSSMVCAMLPTLFLQDSVPYSIVQMPELGVSTVPASHQQLIVDNFDFHKEVNGKRTFRGGLRVSRRNYGNALYEPGDLQEGDIIYKVVLPDVITSGKINPTSVDDVYRLIQDYKQFWKQVDAKQKQKQEKEQKPKDPEKEFPPKPKVSQEEVNRLFSKSSSPLETDIKLKEVIVIKPMTFRSENSLNKEPQGQTAGIVGKKVYYFPFPYDPAGPYFQLSWINASDDTVFIERQENPSSPWKPFNLTEDTRNFTLRQFLSRVPPGIPLTIWAWRSDRTVQIKRLHEAFYESSKGVQLYYTPPVLGEENYVLFNGLGLMDLNVNQIAHCMSDLRQIGMCYPLLPYLDPKEKKYEPTVIVTNVLQSSRINRKGHQQVHVYDRLVEIEAKFVKISEDGKRIGFQNDERFPKMRIHSITELKSGLVKLAKATIDYYNSTVMSSPDRYKSYLKEKFAPLANNFNELTETGSDKDIIHKNWDALIFVILRFKGDERSTCFFPKVLQQDTHLFQINHTRPPKFAKSLKRDVYLSLERAAKTLGVTFEKDDKTETFDSEQMGDASNPPGTEDQKESQKVKFTDGIFVPESFHPAALVHKASTKPLRYAVASPIRTAGPLQRQLLTKPIKSDRDRAPRTPVESVSNFAPDSIITPSYEPCKRCSGKS